jgi:hypothetical protein
MDEVLQEVAVENMWSETFRTPEGDVVLNVSICLSLYPSSVPKIRMLTGDTAIHL